MPLVNLRKIRPQIRSRRLDTLRRVRIMGRAYITFIRAPSKTDLQRLLVGIRTSYLLFVYQVGGTLLATVGLPASNPTTIQDGDRSPSPEPTRSYRLETAISRSVHVTGRGLCTILSHAYLWCICH